MADFTYQVPDEKKFFLAVRQILSKSSIDTERAIADKLANAKCTIVASSQYSGERWNAMSTTIHFYVSVDKLDFFESEQKKSLLRVCDRVMPKDAGYDIQGVEVSPLLDDLSVESTLMDDLDEIKNSVSATSLLHLPDDIKQKGKEMAEVYTYLYCVENSLRLFIDKVLTMELGVNYFSVITVPSNVKKSIQVRKDLEVKNRWIGLRGDQELFYLDFKELANIITANWETFKEYFPDQHWLNVKIEELGNCRNLIAHNSFISDMERDVIRLNYNQILKQIQKVELKKTTTVTTNQPTDELPF
jgi:hypothetical protein